MADGVSVGTLYASLKLDKKGFDQTVHSAGSAFGGLAKAAVAAGVVMLGAVAGFFTVAAQHAADQEKSQRQVQKVFGSSAKAVDEWASKSIRAFGLEDDAAMQAVSTYGLLFKNFGFTTGAAAKMGETMVGTAADLASFKNIPVEDALKAIQGAVAGQTKGLKALGIVIDQTSIQQYALTHHLWDGKGKLDAHAAAAARYGLILERTKVMTGDFAKTSGSMTNQLKIAGAEWDSVLDNFGEIALPLITAILPHIVDALQAIADWASKNAPAIKAVLSGALDAIGTVFGTVGTVIGWFVTNVLPRLVDAFGFVTTKVIPQVVTAVGNVITAVSPLVTTIGDLVGQVQGFLAQGDNMTSVLQTIGIVVAAIIVPAFVAWAAATIIAVAPFIALGAAVFLLVKTLNDLGLMGPIVTAVTGAIGSAFGWLQSTVIPALGAAFDWISTNVLPPLAAAFDWIVQNVIPPLSAIFGILIDNVLPILGSALGAIVNVVQTTWPTISKIIGQVAGVVKTGLDVVVAVLRVVMPILAKIADVLFPAIGTAVGIMVKVIGTAFDVVGTVIGVAAGVIGKILDGVGGAFDKLGAGIGVVAGAVGSVFKGMADIVGAVWKGITDAIKGAINFVIGLIDGIIDAINAVQVHVHIGVGPARIDADWDGLQLGRIPFLAAGTPSFAGGWAVLGDGGGPELAKLPRGTTVYPADQTARMLGGAAGGGGGQHVEINQDISGADPGDVEAETRRALRRAALEWSLG